MGLTTSFYKNYRRHEEDQKINEWRAQGLSESQIKPLRAHLVADRHMIDATDAGSSVPITDFFLVLFFLVVLGFVIRKCVINLKDRNWDSTVRDVYAWRPGAQAQIVPTHGSVAAGHAGTTAHGVTTGQAYATHTTALPFDPDYDEPLADAVMYTTAMGQGGKYAAAAEVMLPQVTESEEFVSQHTQRRFRTRRNLKEEVYLAQTQDDDHELARLKSRAEKLRIQLEIALSLAQIEALEATRAASNQLPSQNRPGLSAHVTDAEIRRVAAQIDARVSQARARGENVEQAAKKEVAALSDKYDPLVIEEIFQYYQNNYSAS